MQGELRFLCFFSASRFLLDSQKRVSAKNKIFSFSGKKLDALQGRAVWREQIKPRLVYPKTPAGGRALLAEQGILQEHTSKGSSDLDLFTGRGKAKDKKCKKKKRII